MSEIINLQPGDDNFDVFVDMLNKTVVFARYSNDPSVQNSASLYIYNANILRWDLMSSGYNHIIPNTRSMGYDQMTRDYKLTRTIHAEENAIMNALLEWPMRGFGASTTLLASPWVACANCARLICQLNINILVRIPHVKSGYWDAQIEEADRMMLDHGVRIYEIDLEHLDVPDDVRLGQFRKNDSETKDRQINAAREVWAQMESHNYANGEVRVVDPVTGGEKCQKPSQLSTIDPRALEILGEVAGDGTEKYARYNYLKGYDWHLSYDAMMRHASLFWQGEDLDPETGHPHMAHAAWHALALVSFLEHDLGTDDRWDPN